MLDAMEAATRTYLQAAVAGGSYLGWLAELPDGRVVGGGGVVICPWPGTPTDHQPRRVWILNIYTEPDHRRRGVARRILEAILAWCRDNGCRSVSLHASNQGRKLYESLGFKPTNEMRLMLP